MLKITVSTEPSYNILVGENLIKEAETHLSPFISNRKVMIVTDENIARHGYLDNLKEGISSTVQKIESVILPAGEKEKNSDNYLSLLHKLAQLQFSRSDILIALGGGVIGDLVGFVAATYMRGIQFIQIPTTLLSAIDSSVGGKTAIDLPEGKNLVGAFYQPALVLCDTTVFKTLNQVDFEDGCSELIKYGVIKSPKLLENMLTRSEILTAESSDLPEIVAHCIEIKRDVIEKDELDVGLRLLLNYGHTIGHAIEQCSGYKVSHGRGVAKGMELMLKIAKNHLGFEEGNLKELPGLLNKYHLLETIDSIDLDDMKEAMMNDKKRRGDSIILVFPESFGQAKLEKVPVEQFMNWFEEVWVDENIN